MKREMTSERYQRVVALFESALEYPPDHRAAFLYEACAGDPSLRVEVEELLASDRKPQGVLDAPLAKPASTIPTVNTSRNPAETSSMTGSTLGPFRILEKLGEGGMGVVYKAEDTALNRIVALKFLSDAARFSDELEKRFTREAQAAARLDHPAICAVHGFFQEGGHKFIAMAYVEGRSLLHRIASGGLTLENALDYTIGIADGLKAAHAKGVVHRDVKPANIIISSEGQPVLTDFGLALLTDRSRITRANTIMGTVQYMSPEQALGREVDRRADVWSLAIVLYEQLAGQTPFQGKNHSAVLSAVIHAPPPPLTRFPAGIGDELNRILSKALSKDTSMRYQHMDDFAVDLAAVRRRHASAHALPVRRPSSANDVSTLTSIDRPAHETPRSPNYLWLLLIPLIAAVLFLLWRFAFSK